MVLLEQGHEKIHIQKQKYLYILQKEDEFVSHGNKQTVTRTMY